MAKKYAYSQWSWGMSGSQDFVRACEDLSRAGCPGIECVGTFFDLFGGYEPFDETCRKYGMTPASIYFFLSGDFEKDVTELLDKIESVVRCGVKTITVQAPFGILHPTEEQIMTVCRTAAAFGKICKPYGIIPCLHPHHNTPIMRKSEIDTFMQYTDPAEVGLCPDTAHLVAGGCDPVEIFRTYQDRIKFVHLKDIDLEDYTGDPIDCPTIYAQFRELGEGTIDFPAIFKILKDAGYDGWLCVELDGSRTTNYDSAVVSMKYLDENW